jgi:hypothetical protein
MVGGVIGLNEVERAFDAQQAQPAAGFLPKWAANQDKGWYFRRLQQELPDLFPGSLFTGRQVLKKQVGNGFQGWQELAVVG